MAEPVVIAGAGPVGLTLALELARHDVASVVLDAKPRYAHEGSKAMVLAGHAFDTLTRLGCPECVRKAIVLERARTYFRQSELFTVEFPRPVENATPRFGNLQQSFVERSLLRRVAEEPLIDLRWGARVEGLEQDDAGITVRTAGGDGVRAAWLVGADGPRSAVRQLLGIDFPGHSFEDRFLIADIRAELPFPMERRFYFHPPWNPGRQILIHPQPDGEWRIDWQVPADSNAETERESGRLDERIRLILGDTPYELSWLSSYRFHQRVAERFRDGRVFLAGDAAHLMAPFGARGLNSGLEDACNLGWRLALVVRGEAPVNLLDSYASERRSAAEENLRVTSATMRFLAPPSRLRRAARNAILRGSVRSGRLRSRVDSGKLAVPAVYPGEAPVGTLAPAGAAREPLEHGFGLVQLDGSSYVVRPDGYVVAAVDGSEAPAEVVRAFLGSA